MLDCEADHSGNSQQALLEAASVQAQIIEGELSTFVVMEGKSNDELMRHWLPADPSPSPSPSVLVAATSSDSDSDDDDDEALHSSNSRYDNHTPPCTGRGRMFSGRWEEREEQAGDSRPFRPLPGEQLLCEDMSLPADR